MKSLRKEYVKSTLDLSDLHQDPIEQFQKWFRDSIAHDQSEPNAMILSTVNEEGRPSSRVVLLKEVNATGLIFFSNYLSRKSVELSANPFASLLFYWDVLERQVRIEGQVEKIPDEDSEQYFFSRPVMSQVGAIVSPQSQVIPDRAFLETRFHEMMKQPEHIKRPEHWGGFCLKPDYFEFWQGRESRLHDRFAYRSNSQSWKIERLAP